MSPNPQPLDSAFARQQERRLEPPAFAERQASLARLELLLRGNVEPFCAALDADFGARSANETRLLEVFPSIEAIAHARRHLRAWMRPQRRATSLWFLPGRSRVVFQPLGVVGIVVPWNYPLYLAIGPLVAALAAGNRVLVKMSEAAPATGELLARLVAAEFDPAILSIVNGGPEVGRAFVALPFDHLLFTGSTEVGRHVMRAAADNLTPVTLELGGKSPAIVGRDVPIEEAAAKILYGKCLNAGQTCIAPDYVLVPEERVDAFVAAARSTVAKLYPTLAANPDYTAIVNDRHRARLRGYLEDAVARGALAIELNPAKEDLSASPKMAPTMLTGVGSSMRVMQDEIFGPILPLVPYRSLDDAIAFVNARPRPLALYVFDRDSAAIDRVLAETTSGGVTVNETILHIAQEDLPFGGVGPSGMGEYHGRAGFETFSKRKAVFVQSRLSGLALFRPPYGKRFQALMRLLFPVKRRRFIQVGLVASALLVTVRWLEAQGRTEPESHRALDPREAEIIRALVPVVLAGSLPADAAERTRAIEETVEAFARAVSGLAPAIQEEIGEMLSLLSFAPTRLAMAGIGAGWRDAAAADISAFLQDWRTSRFELKRAGYRALTQLIQGAWFDNPRAWRLMGYPGPPTLTAPT